MEKMGSKGKASQMLAKMQAIKAIQKQLEEDALISSSSSALYARKLSEQGILNLGTYFINNTMHYPLV